MITVGGRVEQLQQVVLRGRVIHLQLAAQVGREELLQIVQVGMVALPQVVQEGRVCLLQDMEELQRVVQGGKGRVQICLCNKNSQSKI